MTYEEWQQYIIDNYGESALDGLTEDDWLDDITLMKEAWYEDNPD